MSRQRIFLTGGGTAGHVVPLLAVAAALHQQQPTCELFYIGQLGDTNNRLVADSQLPIKLLTVLAGKYRRYHNQTFWQWLIDWRTNLLNLRDLGLLFLGFWQSLWLMLRFRPNALFTKGSFVAVPVGLAAAICRVPIMTHDSDSRPGLANRLLAPFAKRHAVALVAQYPYDQQKVVVTGVPVADRFLAVKDLGSAAAKRAIGLPAAAKVLLITGGSQGAKRLDDLIEQIAEPLLRRFPDLYLIHIFGRLNESLMASRYQALAPHWRSRLVKLGFTSDVERYCAAADVVIGRAGATFLAEFAVLSKACVIVPAEQLTNGHQLHNAQILSDLGAIKMIREGEGGAAKVLEATVIELLEDDKLRRQLGQKLAATLHSNAAAEIAANIWQIRRPK